MPLRLLAILIIGSLTSSFDKPKDKLKDDVELIQGRWDWDPEVKQSDAKPVELIDRVVFHEKSMTLHQSLNDQKFITAMEFKLDPQSTPKAIDFSPTEKDNLNQGKPYLGLYEIKDGQLKICYRGPGSTRPKSFEDRQAGNDLTVILVFKKSTAK